MDRSRVRGALTGLEAGRAALSGPPGTQRHHHHAARADGRAAPQERGSHDHGWWQDARMAREPVLAVSTRFGGALGSASLDELAIVLLGALAAILVLAGAGEPGNSVALASGSVLGAVALVLVARRSMELFVLVVLVLRPAIINLDVEAPDTMQPGMTRTFSASAGQATLFLELYDSVTSELLARIYDAEEVDGMGFINVRNGVTNRADADRMLKKWADLLGTHLQDARAGATAAAK